MALPGFLRSFYCGELFCRIIHNLCNFHFQYCIMDDRQHFIDYTSFIPAIGVFVLIRMANDQLVTMVASHVLCGVLFCTLASRILRVDHIDVVLLWLGGILLWLWYWFRLESGRAVMEAVEMVVG